MKRIKKQARIGGWQKIEIMRKGKNKGRVGEKKGNKKDFMIVEVNLA
jgi:hypothetical protein